MWENEGSFGGERGQTPSRSSTVTSTSCSHGSACQLLREVASTVHRQAPDLPAPPTVAPCIVGGLLKMPRVNVRGDVSASPASAPSMFTRIQARSAGGTCLSASDVGLAPCGCGGRVAAFDAGGSDGTPPELAQSCQTDGTGLIGRTEPDE